MKKLTNKEYYNKVNKLFDKTHNILLNLAQEHARLFSQGVNDNLGSLSKHSKLLSKNYPIEDLLDCITITNKDLVNLFHKENK